MSVFDDIKDTAKFLLVIISSALSSAGMVLLVNEITSHLPRTQDIVMTTIIGFFFILLGTAFGYLAGKKQYGLS